MKEILVTQGANGSLNSFIMAFLNAGDALVTFEPMFPMYLDHAQMAGGKILGVPLTYSEDTKNWEFSMDHLRMQLS